MRRIGLTAALVLAFATYASIRPHVFAVPVLLVIWVLYVLIWPEKPCYRCSGWAARSKGKRKPKACPSCKGTGVRFRLSARLAHKGAATAHRALRERAARRESES